MTVGFAAFRHAFWLSLLLAAGCAVTPSQQPTAPEPAALAAQARKAQDKGDFQAAAQAYLQAAEQATPPQALDYRLRAAEALLAGNHVDQARRLLDTLPAEGPKEGLEDAGAPLGPQLRARRALLTARIALMDNRPRQALSHLQGLPPAQPPLPAALAIAIHELRAQAYLRAGNLLESARERVILEPLLPAQDTRRIHENQTRIWQALLRLSAPALEQLRLAPPPDVFSGWLELALIARRAEEHPQDVTRQVEAWRKRYPAHPAMQDIIDSLLARRLEERRRPATIALLLPHEGPPARAAAALRDGFLAAHYQRSRSDYRPTIRIYDSGRNAASAMTAYEQAVRDGADFIVGPLRKEAVNELAGRPRLPVPTLSLNYSSDGHPPTELFQFGLAPEDEARQVAERAWLEGNNQALALLPEGPWGERLLEAFRATWEELGGTLLEVQFYPPRDNDFSQPIQALLNLDESLERRRRLEKLIGQSLKFEPRRRRDADFVFLGAFPRQARLIRPQLKFHYASQLPVYATSHIFTGRRDRAADRDMDDIVFCDIPWVLGDPPPLKKTIERLWPEQAGQYTRFYALGVDAYRIIPFLDNLRAYRYERFAGQTGALYLDRDNRIFRELAWARFRGGIPRPY